MSARPYRLNDPAWLHGLAQAARPAPGPPDGLLSHRYDLWRAAEQLARYLERQAKSDEVKR